MGPPPVALKPKRKGGSEGVESVFSWQSLALGVSVFGIIVFDALTPLELWARHGSHLRRPASSDDLDRACHEWWRGRRRLNPS